MPHSLHGVDLGGSISAIVVMLESREVTGGVLVASSRVLVLMLRGHWVE